MTSSPTSLWRFTVSQALIFLMAWMSLAPAVHGGGHDQDCDPAVVFHDAAQHQIGDSRATADGHPIGDHCLACHFFRLSRHAAPWRFVPQELDQRHLRLHTDRTAATTVPVLLLPARAPPSIFA